MTAETLKAERAKLGLTQKDLAAKLPVAPRTLSHWEQGRASIPEYLRRALRDLERELTT